MRIDARNLGRSVKRGRSMRMILKDVSLSIAPHEFIALVGGSGAGKSTLMKALSGYDRATSGEVQVNGDNFYSYLRSWKSFSPAR